MRVSQIVITAVIAGVLAGGAILAVACSHSSGASGSSGDLGQLERDTGVTWIAVTNTTFGTVSYLYSTSTPPVALTAGMQPEAAAMAFLVRYGAVFQMVDPAHELAYEASGTSFGLRSASFTQTEGAASVYGTRLTVVFDAGGHIAFVSGLYVPGLRGLSTTAKLSPSEAKTKAEADMATRYPKGALVSLGETPPPELIIYPIGSSPALAYSMLVSYAGDTATDTTARLPMFYVVDAATGSILEATSAAQFQYTGPGGAQVTASGVGQQTLTVRTFPALGTSNDGGQATAPYYMQVRKGTFQGAVANPMFVRTPNNVHPPVLPSPVVTSWDGPDASVLGDPGSAVDAYYYLREVDAWWQAHGRNGYDNASGQLGIVVHDDWNPEPTQGPCTNNAYWSFDEKAIHVCPHALTGNHTYATYATSSDLLVMGHEFQHAVTQYTLQLAGSGVPGALGESLGDIMGEFIAHDLQDPSGHCVVGEIFDPSVPLKEVAGLRNMIDPHQSAEWRSDGKLGDPDNIDDPLYYNGSDNATFVHANDGVANAAWSLMTFGGMNGTQPNRAVSSSFALGWNASEQLYLSLMQLRPIGPLAGFRDLAYPLVGLVSGEFGGDSPQKKAVACAWYAVGVLSDSDMRTNVLVDPCACNAPDAGSCDAGSDGGNVYNQTYNCLVNIAEGGTAFECITQQQFTAADALAACAVQGSGPFTSSLIASCPAGSLLGCCRAGETQTCAYESIAWDSLKTLCTAENGTLNSSGNAPNSPDAGPPSDGGHDAGRDASTDATLPPHC